MRMVRCERWKTCKDTSCLERKPHEYDAWTCKKQKCSEGVVSKCVAVKKEERK